MSSPDGDSEEIPLPKYVFGPATILNSELAKNLAIHGSLTEIRGRSEEIISFNFNY